MEGIDVHKLPRKELLQLCTDHSIRTAGVKQDDLIRLLEKKLRPPASDSTRKASSVLGANSPVSSPKARSQSSANSPFSASPNTKGKSAERASMPKPGSTTQGRSLRPLVLVDDRSRNSSRNNSPEPSPRTPRKDQLSPNPGVKPRTPITTKSNAAPAPQRSADLLRKKVNSLTAIGKLQAQERTRPAQAQIDGYSVRGRYTVAPAPIGKQAQETRRQPDDRGSSVRSRSSAVVGGPKKNIKSTSMPVKRPGERTVGVKSSEASGKGKSANPNATGHPEAAASSPRASEGEASVAATDLGSHSFNSVSEVATDAGHHAMWDDSDADDAQSVSSEPVSRFALQSLETERFNHFSRTSTGSKLGRVAYPSWESADRRRSSLDSSVESNTLLGKDFELSTAPGEDLLSSYSLEYDTAFDLVGDAHGLEISSFLDAHSGAPEVKAAEGSHPLEELGLVQESDIIAKPVNSMGEQDAVSETAPSTMQKDIVSDNDRGELINSEHPKVENDVPVSDYLQKDSSIPAVESNAPVTEQKAAATPLGSREQEIEMTISAPGANEQEVATTPLGSSEQEIEMAISAPGANEQEVATTPLGSSEQEIEMAISAPEANDIPVASSTDVTDAIEVEGGQGVGSKENAEGDKWFDSTLDLVQDEDSSLEGANSQASMGKNIQLLTEYPAPCNSPSHQEPLYDSGMQLPERNDPTCCVGKDYTVSSTAECIEGVHFNMDSAPLPHPDMERSSLTIMSINRPDASPMPDSSAGDLCTGKSASPCDELQPGFDIKLRGGQGGSSFGPKNDHNKGRIRKSILLQSDRSEKVPLLQDGRENENMQLVRRTFPSSILLWCSQLFSAIFGTRSCQH